MNEQTPTSEGIFVFLITLSVIGTIGNSIVSFVYWRKQDRQTSTFFVLLMSLNDLAITAILLPFTIYMEKIQFLTDNIYFCKTFFFLTTTIVPSSSLLMLALTFDRYFCICMVDKNIMNLHRAKIIAIVLLVVGLFCGIIPGWNADCIYINYEYFIENSTTGNFSSFGFICMISVEKNSIVRYFKNFYDTIYFISVILITLLYGLIFREIYIRQKLKNKRDGHLMLQIVMSKANKPCYSQSFVTNKEFYDLSRKFENSEHSKIKNTKKCKFNKAVDWILFLFSKGTFLNFVKENKNDRKNIFEYFLDLSGIPHTGVLLKM